MSKIILASEVVDYYLPICVSLTAPPPFAYRITSGYIELESDKPTRVFSKLEDNNSLRDRIILAQKG